MELPERFLASMKEMLRDEYQEFVDSYQQDRHYGLRVNTSKISLDEFERIAPFGIRKIPWIPNGYFFDGKEQPAKHPYYYAGLYYLQEPSAMTPASRLPIEPGDKVLDLCAAPGGKATELGVRLQGKGVLVANDVSASRAKALLKNIELFGIPNVFVVSETPERLCAQFEGFFDKILVDAPCSGEGMFRKEPAIIKNWEHFGTGYYAKLQRDILPYAVRMLKPGGMMLYSTCTFSKEEDEEAVRFIRENDSRMKLVAMEGYEGFGKGLGEGYERCVRIWPHKMSGEGHFMALLQKDGEAPQASARSSAKPRTAKRKEKGMEDVYAFMERVATPFPRHKLELWGEKAYLMPEALGERTGMRFLRNGLYLGDRKKNRFEPSQALAMTLKADGFDSIVSLDGKDERVIRYLKGESVNLTGIPTGRDAGWQLVCVDGYPLGWGKLTGGTLKNKYQAGWRFM